MYLTQLSLNQLSQDVRRDISNIHNMHRRVLSMYSDDQLTAARAHFQVLYRLESDLHGGLRLLVQSKEEPHWKNLPHHYLVDDDVQPKSSTALASQLAKGQIVRFRLRANPTKRLRTGTKQAGKRIELFDLEQQMLWFARQADRAGLAPVSDANGWVECLRIIAEPKARGTRKGATITAASVLYEGIAQVEDIDALTSAIRDGIGPAKSYGFGLLSVAIL